MGFNSAFKGLIPTSSPDNDKWSDSRPCRFIPMKNLSLTHSTGSGFLRKDRTLLALLGIQSGFLGHTDDSVVTTLTELSLLKKRLKCDTKKMQYVVRLLLQRLQKFCLVYPIVLHMMCIIHV